MADLEKNLEQAIEEAMQPNSKAEKGDSKPVKQGSSDAASIESGKGEVVKQKRILLTKQLHLLKVQRKEPKKLRAMPNRKVNLLPRSNLS